MNTAEASTLSTAEHALARADGAWPLGNHELRAGIESNRMWYDNSARSGGTEFGGGLDRFYGDIDMQIGIGAARGLAAANSEGLGGILGPLPKPAFAQEGFVPVGDVEPHVGRARFLHLAVDRPGDNIPGGEIFPGIIFFHEGLAANISQDATITTNSFCN